MSKATIQEKLLAIGKQVLAESDLDRVLEVAMDEAIAATGAQRGMVILFDDAGEPRFQTARNLRKQDIDHPEFETSRTIIQRTRTEGEPIYLPNALEDKRLDRSESVMQLRILSVLSLPLKDDGRVFGLAYLDSRSIGGLFSEETFEFAKNFADFIGVVARNALDRHDLSSQVASLETKLRGDYRFEEIVGNHSSIVHLLKLITQVARSDARVLINGENGTGKELVARAIHNNSERKDKEFVAIHCGAFTETLLTSELFGHVQGAFTGAHPKKGWFETADGSTIFLDEVNSMPFSLQTMLLRVLEKGEFSPVGSTAVRKCNVRVLAASNQPLRDLIRAGKFREDLFFRLNVFEATAPALRDRKSDIPLLARHFLELHGRRAGRSKMKMSRETEICLMRYDYPGNIRELKNIIHHGVVLCTEGMVQPEHLPVHVCKPSVGDGDPDRDTIYSFRDAKQQFERNYIINCLKATRGNATAAARLASIDVSNFRDKMNKHSIKADRFKAPS